MKRQLVSATIALQQKTGQMTMPEQWVSKPINPVVENCEGPM